MLAAAEAQQFEAAARLRDQLSTVHQLQEKQRVATAEMSDDADVFGYHFEAGSLAVNLFHVREGKIVDRREFFWDDLPELIEPPAPDEIAGAPSFRRPSGERVGDHEPQPDSIPDTRHPIPDTRHPIPDTRHPIPDTRHPIPDTRHPIPDTQSGPHEALSALLKQLYIDQHYVPRTILVPVDFPDRDALAALLTERTFHRLEIAVPQRGERRSLVDLAGQNAKQSYIQRFRVLEPSRKAIQESLADTLMLPELPRRIECFDISHIQGAETVASLVVWEDGKMNKQLYRKFQIKTVEGVDDFASMREVVYRRYRRLLEKINDENPGNAASPATSSDPEGALSYPRSVRIGWESTRPNDSIGPGARGLDSQISEPTNLDPALPVLKGHDFSRADNGPHSTSGALAPEGRTSKSHSAPHSRTDKEPSTLPSLILIDGGLGQLHAAADALEELGLTSQPLASIAKKEEIIYLYGQEDDPIVLDRRSPVLHLIQVIRDESHRFAVGYHRQRRAMRDRDSELNNIPGVGPQTRQRLLTHFGSLRDIQNATAESLAAVLPRKTANAVWRHFHAASTTPPKA
jgi:excinuclease UvrABC nuclease subunit